MDRSYYNAEMVEFYRMIPHFHSYCDRLLVYLQFDDPLVGPSIFQTYSLPDQSLKYLDQKERITIKEYIDNLNIPTFHGTISTLLHLLDTESLVDTRTMDMVFSKKLFSHDT